MSEFPRMPNIMRRTLLCCLLALPAVGCTIVPAGGVQEPLVLAPPADYPAEAAQEFVFDCVIATFKNSLFEVDQVDRAAGRISTAPLTGMGLFEFWRRDAIGVQNYVDGSLNKVRRSAVAEVRRLNDGTYTVEMWAGTERYSNPKKASPSPGELFGVSRFLQNSPLERRRNPSAVTGTAEAEGGNWEDVGRDREFERALLARLEYIYKDRLAVAVEAEAAAAAPANP